MSNGADYVVLYTHMEATARLMEARDALGRGNAEDARRAVDRALAASRETATLIERTARQTRANDPR